MSTGERKRLAAARLLPVAGLMACLVGFVLSAATPPPPPLNDPVEGMKLAREMLAVQPAENIEFSGVMKIARPNADEKVLPLRTKVIVVSDTSWKSIYEARLPNGGVESLTILHARGQLPAYELRRGDAVDTKVETNGALAFAGSDFTLFDLGLGFMHWPTQLLYTRQMRKGAGCDVLESQPGGSALYSKVRSWVAQESRAQSQPGLVMAETYDKNGKLLKEFEVNGFKTGQVTAMELRNRETKARTRLLFDSDKQ
jgi:hypothetical protein